MRSAHLLLTLVVCGIGAASAAACDSEEDPVTPTGDAGSNPDTGTTPRDSGPGTDTGTDSGPDPYDGFTKADFDRVKTFGPLPAVPADPTNKYADNAAAATLGQMLFFDKSYSGAIVTGSDGTNGGLGAAGETGKVSCASCHDGAAQIDTRSKPGNVSLGIDHGTRNALAIVNSSFYVWTNWGGRFDSQWSLPPAVAENPKTMASSRLAIAHMIWDKYKTEYEAVFPALDPALDPNAADAARFPAAGKPKAAASDPDGPWELMDPADRTIVMNVWANYGKALQAYMRKIVSRNAPIDKYIAGDRAAISAAAKRGIKVFLGKGNCIACHSGPTFSDQTFHALGVPQTGPKVPTADLGRNADVPGLLGYALKSDGPFSDNATTGRLTGLVQTDAQKGQFRTPSLRHVAQSAPYMHSGQHATLGEVIDFYAAGGGDIPDAGFTKDPLMKPFTLAGTDKADLIEFLGTLTGDAIPGTLTTNTAK